MALDEDLFDWALSRPWWQQLALARLASGQLLGDSDYIVVADALQGLSPAPAQGSWLGGTLRPVVTGGAPVRLLAVGDVSNVNALVDDQKLTFEAAGLTVVYGDNGSGKSGYARLLKRSVRARHREDVLPDIFESSGGPSCAVIDYAVGDETGLARWEESAPALSQVTFYDEKCGDCYVSMEAEVTYRPGGLHLLDALIGVCDGVRDLLEQRIAGNTRAAVSLPALPESTASAAFVRSLTPTREMQR